MLRYFTRHRAPTTRAYSLDANKNLKIHIFFVCFESLQKQFFSVFLLNFNQFGAYHYRLLVTT